jgi:hypothetical protein
MSRVHTPPEVISLVLADHVHRDGATGKYTLLGTYNSLMMREYPCLRQELMIYTSLTDGHGQVPVRLVLTDADEELGAIATAEGCLNVGDPTGVWEIVFHLRNVVFPRPGHYRIQLHSGEHLLRELRLEARELSVPA